MWVESFLERLRTTRGQRGQLAAVRTLPAREAVVRPPAEPLSPAAQRFLAAAGVTELYAHQAAALERVRRGADVVVATGTASGKSLCYHLPVVAALTAEPAARALYVFPAKALAYDQLGGLTRCVADAELAEEIRPACYDGDTPTHQRPGIRRSANVLLTNPDMLHQGVLPYNAKWAHFFAQLKYVVLDEIHTYRGIFGSHVANVVRRLQRVCRHYGADPQFICCSATLGNPRELAARLIGRPVELVDEDGAPRGARWIALWNPPWIDGDPAERAKAAGQAALTPAMPVRTPRIARRSANREAEALLQRLLEEDAGTIVFCKARVVAELIYKYVSAALQRKRPDLVRRLRPYRGGYLPNERREIEAALFSGELLGVCSTNALELGIDVGALDAAVVVGFPGTLCSLWQQMGRAGRRQAESLAIFVAYDDPVDQYLMRNPEFIFERPLESAVIDPENPHILAAQLGCAAFELPLTADDLAGFGATAAPVAQMLVDDQKLRESQQRFYWSTSDFPASQVNLRTISNATYAIVDGTDGRDTVIGQVDSISAPELIYPEAVYLHQGETYVVRELDAAARLARVQRLDADYYTQPVLADECRLGTERLSGAVCGGRKAFGDVTVRWQTIAFRKFKLYTQELIGQTALHMPALEVRTTGVWLQPPAEALAAVRDAGAEAFEALSGVRNMLVVALPPLAMCDRYDIGGMIDATQLGVSTIILYDRYEGGVGFARHGYDHCERLLRLAHELIAGCGCADGCPGCVGPPNLRIAIHHDPDLGRGYAIPDKRATLTLLEAWLNADGARA